MAKTIKLKKGLDINLMGKAEPQVKIIPVGGKYALQPDDFYGFKPKVVVKEGDSVLAGDPLFVNKQEEELKVTSPVSGKIIAINRGARRKVLSIEVEADETQQFKSFTTFEVQSVSADAVKALLLESGMFAYIKQRPFDVTASISNKPKAIFVSTFSKMPLATDFMIAYKGNEDYFQVGITALSRIAKVYIGVNKRDKATSLTKVENAEVNIFSGPNPSGNVGVQINHICPINKDEVVWTIGAEEVIFIGKLFTTGKVDYTRTIAVAGSMIKTPSYVKTLVGTCLQTILADNLNAKEHVRIINGNPLVGIPAQIDSYLAAHATEVTAIPEGDDKDEILGWIMPRFKDFSTSRSYFSWLQCKKKTYNLDARIKGGERHMIMSGEYDKVFPMDIFAGYLIKAIIAGDIDRMEQLGIYEVSPEDFAVAEFVDSSKLELQNIVRQGLDMLRKEMA